MWSHVLIALIPLIRAAVPECSHYPVHLGVDLKKLDGVWYLQFKSEDTKELIGEYKCMRNYYHASEDGTSADFVEAVLPLSDHRTWEGKSYYSTIKRNSTSGVHYMKIIDPKHGEVDLPFYFLNTDYENHLITYVCFHGMKGTWVLTRQKAGLDGDRRARLVDILAGADLSLDKFTVMPQDNCP